MAKTPCWFAGMTALATVAATGTTLKPGRTSWNWEKAQSRAFVAPRSSHIMTMNSSYVVLTGGSTVEDATSYYQISSNQMFAEGPANLPNGRMLISGTASSTVHTDVSSSADQNYVLSFGGVDGSSSVPRNDLYHYNPSNNVWTALSAPGPAPLPRKNAAGVYMPECSNSSATAMKDCFIVHGGIGVGDVLLGDADVLNLNPGAPLAPIAWERPTGLASSLAPSPRHSHTMVAHMDGHSAMLFGGQTASGVSDDLYLLSPSGFNDPRPSEMTNLASGASVTMSSADPVASGPSSRVTDGVITGTHNPAKNVTQSTWPGYNQCAQTGAGSYNAGTATPTIMVDLGSAQFFHAIQVYGRTDCNTFTTTASMLACTLGMQHFELWTGSSSAAYNAPGNALCNGVEPPMDNIKGGKAFVPCVNTARYVFLVLPGVNRTAVVCELRVLQKQPWQWRKLSGTLDAAQNEYASARSTSINGYTTTGVVVDGFATNDLRTQSCVATRYTHAAPADMTGQTYQQVTVDLGDVYQVRSLKVWPVVWDGVTSGVGTSSTYLMPNRTRDWHISVGNSPTNPENLNTQCSGRVIADLWALRDGSGGAPIECNAEGRFVTFRRYQGSRGVWDYDDTVGLCEVQVIAETMLDHPAPRAGHAATGFRGQMVIFGGYDSNGYLLNDLRFFDMLNLVWMQDELEPMGTKPDGRSYAQLMAYSSTTLLLSGGVGGRQPFGDLIMVKFAACPTVSAAGVGAGTFCHQSGTACEYACVPGYDNNLASTNNWLVCLPDSTFLGSNPPCSAYKPQAPISVTAAAGAQPGTIQVSWVPSSFGSPAATHWQVNAIPDPNYQIFDEFDDGALDTTMWTWTDPSANPVAGITGTNELLVESHVARIGAFAGMNCMGANVALCPRLQLNAWPASLSINNYEVETHASLDPETEGFGNANGGIVLYDTSTQRIQFMLSIRVSYPFLQVVFESVHNAGKFFVPVDLPIPFATGMGVYLKLRRSSRTGNAWEAFWRTSPLRSWIAVPRLATVADFGAGVVDGSNIRPGLAVRNYVVTSPTTIGGQVLQFFDFDYFRLGSTKCETNGPEAIVQAGTGDSYLMYGLTPGMPYLFELRGSNDGGATYSSALAVSASATATPAVPGVVSATVDWSTQMPSFMVPPPITGSRASLANDANWNTALFPLGGNTTYGCAVSSLATQNSYSVEPPTGFVWTVDLAESVDVQGIRIATAATNPQWMNGFTIHVGDSPDWEDGDMVDEDLTPYNMSVAPYTQQFTFDTPYVGRYVSIHLPPTPGQTMQLCEVRVASTNTCPPLPLPSNNLTLENPYNSNCAQQPSFVPPPGARSICATQCAPGSKPIGGSAVATCRGASWSSQPLTCAPVCPDNAPDASIGGCTKSIINEGFSANYSIIQSQWIPSDPRQKWNSYWFAPTDNLGNNLGKIQAAARPGCMSEMVVVSGNADLMELSSDHEVQVVLETGTQAGMVLRYQSRDDYYLYYIDVANKMAYFDVVWGGNETQLQSAYVPWLADESYYKLTADVSDNGFVLYLGLADSVHDGAMIMEVVDNQMTWGNVGLYASTDAWFDSITVTTPCVSCNGATEGQTCTWSCKDGYTVTGTAAVNSATMRCSTSNQTAAGVDWFSSYGSQPTCVPQQPLMHNQALECNEGLAMDEPCGTPIEPELRAKGLTLNLRIVGGNVGNAFYIGQCDGQLYVANPAMLTASSNPVFTLIVNAYIAEYPSIAVNATVVVYLLNVPEAPVIVPDQNFTIPENAALGLPVGVPAFELMDPQPLTWSLLMMSPNYPGLFSINAATGMISVSASSAYGYFDANGNSYLDYENTAYNVYSLQVKAALAADPSLWTSEWVTVILADQDDAPQVDTTALLRIPETAGVFDVFVPALQDVTTDEDTLSQWKGSPRYSAILPSKAASVCTPAALRIQSASPIIDPAFAPVVNASDINSSPLFSIDPTTGAVSVAALPLVPWTSPSRTPFNFFGNVAWAGYQLCVNVSSGYSSGSNGNDTAPWRLQVIHAGVVLDLTSRISIIMCSASPASTSVMPTSCVVGVTCPVITCSTRNLQSNHVITARWGDSLTAYSSACVSDVAGQTITCNTSSGVGGPLVWSFTDSSPGYAAPVVLQVPFTLSYAAPLIYGFLASNGKLSNTNVSTTGGSVIHMLGANLGSNLGVINASMPSVTVSVGNNGQYACAYLPPGSPGSRSNNTTISCMMCAGAGANLPIWVTVSGQTYIPTGSQFRPTMTFIHPVFRYAYASGSETGVNVSAGTYGLDAMTVAGGDTITIVGDGFGPGLDPSETISVTFGGSDGKASALANCIHTTPADTHITCVTAPGTGTNLPIRVTIAGQDSLVPTTCVGNPDRTGQCVSYATPTITAVYGPGTLEGSTAGSEIIYIEGHGFGPVTLGGAANAASSGITSLTYGPNDAELHFSAESCWVDQEPPGKLSRIQCMTSAGTGRMASWQVNVAGQVSPIYHSSSAAYARPVVDDVNLPASAQDGLSTLGGEAILITGANFGPADAYTAARLAVWMGVLPQRLTDAGVNGTGSGNSTAVNAVALPLGFNLAPCVILIAFTQISCRVPAGIGSGLQVVVTVNGQRSAPPTVSYHKPVVTAFMDVSGTANVTSFADPNLNYAFDVWGQHFGPVSYFPCYPVFGSFGGCSNTSRQTVTAVTYGPSGSEYIATFTHNNLNFIRAHVGPNSGGNGQPMRVRVTIGNEMSDPSDVYFTYPQPAIVSMFPTTANTFSDPTSPTIITLIGTSLPLLDVNNELMVRLEHGVYSVLLRPFTPSTEGGLLEFQNADGSYNISFELPRYYAGANLDVRLVLQPRDSPSAASLNYITYPSPITTFSYNGPTITSIVTTRPPWQMANSSSVCPFPQGYMFGCNDDNLLQIVMLGTNFGPGPGERTHNDGVVRAIEMLTPIGNTSVLQWDATSIYWSQSTWSNTRLVAYSSAPEGRMRVRLTTSGTSVGVDVDQTAEAVFQAISPSIGSITGSYSAVPTAGGATAVPVPVVLTLQVDQLDSADNVFIMVGDTVCPLVLDDAATQYVTDARVQVITAQQPGPWWTLKCVPPAGQGSVVPVRVMRDTNGVLQGSDTAATLSYLPPTITSYEVQKFDGTWVFSNYSATTILRAPTNGTMMRIHGTNMGPSPVVTIGDGVYIQGNSSIVPCAGTEGSHTCYQFVTPPGEGRGEIFVEYAGSGFWLDVQAGDQYAPSAPFAYATAVVTKVNTTSGLFPTTGSNDTVYISGYNFGQPNQYRDVGQSASLIKVEFAVSGDTSATYGVCANPGRWSHSLITCTLPPFGGRAINVRVTVLDQVGTTNGVFSYDPPVITEAWSMALVMPRDPPVCVNETTEAWDSDAQAPVIITTTVCQPAPAPRNPIVVANPVLQAQLPTGQRAFRVTGGRTDGAGGIMLTGSTEPRSNIIVLIGHNFGAPSNLNCPMLAWTYRPSGSNLNCNNGEDFLGEGEQPQSNVIMWSHTMIVFYSQAGMGLKDVEVVVRGMPTGLSAADSRRVHFRYDAPTIFGVLPQQVDTDGISQVQILATDMGPIPLDFSISTYKKASTKFSPALALDQAPFYPTAILVAVVGRLCVSSARTVTGDIAGAVRGCSAAMPYSGRTHESLLFTAPPGVGPFKDLVLRVVDMSAPDYVADPVAFVNQADSIDFPAYPMPDWHGTSNSIVTPDRADEVYPFPQRFDSNVATISYDPPVVLAPFPSDLRVDDGSTLRTLTLVGSNFGDPTRADVDLWSTNDRRIEVTVGGVPCVNAQRLRRSGAKDGTGVVIECSVDSSLIGAGYQGISATIADQPMPFRTRSNYTDVLVTCAPGYFAHAPDGYYSGGESCAKCPAEGAVCIGYDVSAPTFSQRFTYPIVQPGYYNYNASDIKTATGSSSACPASHKYPFRDVCIAPCPVPEACIGENFCAPGYISVSPTFACAACAKDFYKRSNVCVKCPDVAPLLMAGYAVLVLLHVAAAWWITRKGIHVGMVSLGMDFLQIVAMLAYSKVSWNNRIRDMFHVFSAWYLNVEIVAPECTLNVKNLSYIGKFGFVAAMPFGVVALMGFVQVLVFLWRALVMGRRRKLELARGMPEIISSMLLLLSQLYIYETETMLQPFNCAPTTPPTYDAAGKLIYFLSVQHEQCYVKGGIQQTLLPYAAAGCVVYVAGYPLAIFWNLWRKREQVMEDQLLRAKGTGNDRLSGPQTYEMRKMLGRVYYQFKPDYFYWSVVIMLRKFCFLAVMLVLFNRNGSYQMAACLLVLVMGYALHVRIQPYMGPGLYEDVLRDHQLQSLTNSTHARLRASIAQVESRGRKRVHKNLLNFDGRIDRSALTTVLSGWLLDYNSVEAALIFAQIIVALMGLMMERKDANTYPDTMDATSTVTMLVVALAITYWALAMVVDTVMVEADRQRAAAIAASSRAKARKSVGKDADDGSVDGKKTLQRRPSAILRAAEAIESVAAGGSSRRLSTKEADRLRRASSARSMDMDGDGSSGAAGQREDSSFNPLFTNPGGAAGSSSSSTVNPMQAGRGGGSTAAAVAAGSATHFGLLANSVSAFDRPPAAEQWQSVRDAIAEALSSAALMQNENNDLKRLIQKIEAGSVVPAGADSAETGSSVSARRSAAVGQDGVTQQQNPLAHMEGFGKGAKRAAFSAVRARE